MGVLAALQERQRSGRGQRVDTSLLEAAIVHTYWQSAICLATGRSPGPMGSAHPLNAPYQAFETADGWITVGAANQANWERLLKALEAPELAADPRFASNRDRMTHLAELTESLTPLFRTRGTDDWLTRLAAVGLPAGPVLTVGEMHGHPHVQAREMVTTVEHAALGPVETIGAPVKFSRTAGGPQRGAPVYGQHTREILEQAGFTAQEIAELAAAGAIGLHED